MDIYDDEDFELIAAKPYLTGQAQAQALRQPQPRPRPLPLMPTSGVEMPQPQPGADPRAPTATTAARPDYRSRALDMMQQAADAGPTEAERQALVDYQRGRYQGAGPDMAVGMMIAERGGRAGREFGGQILKNALAAREPLKVEGGYVTADQFVTDPAHAARQRTTRLETQAKIYETMAHNADTVEQRAAAAKAADETRREIAKDQNETRRMIAANRPAPQEPLVQVFDPNTNSVIYVPRSQAAGKQAPASAKGGFAGPKMPNEIARMSIGIRALETTLDEFEQALKTFGPRTGSQLDPTQRANMASMAARVHMEAKEMFSLGALTGPDMDMLTSVIANPASFKGVLYGKGGLNEQLGSIRNAVKARKGAIAEQYGSGAGGAGGGMRDPAGVTNFPGARGGPPPGAVQRLD